MAQLNNGNEIIMLVVTLSVLILASLWYKLTRSSSSPPLPPGPRSLPIVGYLPFLGPDLHKQFTNMAHTYGPIYKFYLGSKLHVVINTPELAKEVVRDNDETFANHDLTVASSVITYGGQDIVFSKHNSNWRNLRKIFVYEVLSNTNLEACGCFRRVEVRKTIKNVFSRIGITVNISQISFLTEANVLTSMVRENKPDEMSNGINLGLELQMAASNIAEIFGRPNLSDFFPSLARFDLQGVERDMKKQLQKLDAIIENMIDDRIKSNSRRSRDEVHEGKKDFLQILLDLKDQGDSKSINITQIKAILVDVMIAGTETTAKLSEWAMAEILKNHNVLRRVQEELAEVVGLNNIVEESHLPKLQYLDATVKETFRLHPVTPFLVPRILNTGTIPWSSNLRGS
uniref:Cytochrome P450 76C1-like n=1 Tax=Tanacetum cinerariifolium TaxID=118510 RepID=A0A6L2N7S8_TANCI|nr:cytochrome P450 76C1-like [Tanacetum cinerariifolium]